MSVYRSFVFCMAWATFGLLLAGAAPAQAEEPVKTEAVATQSATETQETVENLRDPEAMAELKRATSFLTGLPRFQFSRRSWPTT